MKKPDNYSSELLDSLLNEITPEEQEKTNKTMELAVKIADAIKNKGWKKKEFAEKLNKKPSEISKWLSGTHNFTLDTLFDIERILDIKLIDTKSNSVIPESKIIHFSITQNYSHKIDNKGDIYTIHTDSKNELYIKA